MHCFWRCVIKDRKSEKFPIKTLEVSDHSVPKHQQSRMLLYQMPCHPGCLRCSKSYSIKTLRFRILPWRSSIYKNWPALTSHQPSPTTHNILKLINNVRSTWNAYEKTTIKYSIILFVRQFYDCHISIVHIIPIFFGPTIQFTYIYFTQVKISHLSGAVSFYIWFKYTIILVIISCVLKYKMYLKTLNLQNCTFWLTQYMSCKA